MPAIETHSGASSCLRLTVLAFVVLSALSGCGGGGGGGASSPAPMAPTLPHAYTASGKAATGGVFVHLFEWKWTDIAKECESFLGPTGYAAVQVSPPNEHAIITGTSPPYPWWQRYQPVGYGLSRSRSGTLGEFQQMVTRCKAAGVDIYVDAVINHMAAGSGVGSDGHSFSARTFPTVPYAPSDFHSQCDVSNYNDANNVQNCDLVGLPDLNTGSDPVRQKIADYLSGLVNLNVAGFRIDAAKHISLIDLDAIVSKVNGAAAAAGKPQPYYFLEVIDNSGEAVKASDYYGVGFASGGASDITEFQYSYRISDAFLNRNSQTVSSLLANTAGLLPSDKAVVFTNNHDNQRAANIYFADGGFHDLAYVYLLAQPYGYASIMSSYAFNRTTQARRDAGPPSDSSGNTSDIYDAGGTPAGCSPGPWVCEHRRRTIANMVKFRRATKSIGVVTDVKTIGPNQVGFGRGDRGFVVINRDNSPLTTATFTTGMAPGNYCDVLSGDYTPTPTPACVGGNTITVDPSRQMTVTVSANSAIAIHADAKLP